MFYISANKDDTSLLRWNQTYKLFTTVVHSTKDFELHFKTPHDNFSSYNDESQMRFLRDESTAWLKLHSTNLYRLS